MAQEPVRRTSSADIDGDLWTWMIAIGLIVFALIVGVGGMALMSINQQAQTATGSQAVPSPR